MPTGETGAKRLVIHVLQVKQGQFSHVQYRSELSEPKTCVLNEHLTR